MLTLSEINIYPIKSLGGISLQSSEVEERGLKYDRRWVLVDESNTFFTQRDFPDMALIKVSVEKNGLMLSHKTKIV
ncbi:MAG: MOSC domain-containing protein, partial [Ignavibacteriaceae bacterium]|nr:MOSC domain-containing protein [Ignavibacteriaceae bacterium]